MSLLFTGSLSDNVNCGGATSVLANQENWSAIAWIYATSVPADAGIVWKGTAPAGNERFLFFFGPGLGNALEIGTARATTYGEARAPWANFAVEGTDKWLFVGATMSSSTAGDCRLWMGDLTTVATQPSAYTVQTNGAGSYTANTSHVQMIGNRDPSLLNHSFDGRIAIVGIWTGVLTEAQILAQQFNPKPTTDCIGFWILGYDVAGNANDWTANGNHGTVSGATRADHVPIPRYFLSRF